VSDDRVAEESDRRARAEPTLDRAERESRRFVEQVVIGLGLCPFAKEPWQAGRVAVRVSEARDVEALLVDLAVEAERLVASDAADLETTLLVHPFVLTDFGAYNDFLDLAEGLLRDRGHAGVLQIASFHPDYRFAGEPPSDPAHATNRSPWPMLHLLREASVSAAVDAHPDAAAIPARNVALLRELGGDRVRALLGRLRDAGDG
jgi:hypothetical protein